MEREYLVSFIIVILVIAILLLVGLKFYPNIFKDVSNIAEDVFKFGAEGKKVEATQVSIKNLIESLAKCQKYNDSNCTCEILGKKKEKLPKGYRVLLRFSKSKDNKPEITLLAYDDEDKIVPVKADTQAIKLEGLKLGIAYWGTCKDKCGSELFGKLEDKYFESKTKFGARSGIELPAIYCVFSSEATGGSDILITGDKDGNWVFPFYKTEGRLYDQAFSEFGGVSFMIGNIFKLGNNRYCFMTTNLERHKIVPPEFSSKDDVVKLFYGASPKGGGQKDVIDATRDFLIDTFEDCGDKALESS